jgi:hypothetical protein
VKSDQDDERDADDNEGDAGHQHVAAGGDEELHVPLVGDRRRVRQDVQLSVRNDELEKNKKMKEKKKKKERKNERKKKEKKKK